MSAITTIAQDTTHNAGVPPVPPEAHQQAEVETTYRGLSATYSPEDNKLRLYSVSRLPKELYQRVRDMGFIWAPRQEVFVAPAWTPGREDLLIELCGEIGDEDTSLVDRAEQRADRFSDYSDSRTRDAQNARNAVSAIADNIPFGQPILVGHHSERRARKDAERIENGMRRAVQMWDTAKYWEQRAAGAIRHARYKERPDVRYRRIKKLEAEQRKQQKTVDESRARLAQWGRADLAQAQAVAIANVDHLHIRDGEGGHTSLWSLLNREQMTPAEAAKLAIDAHERQIAWAERWLSHLSNRLAYERAMLGESGGIAADGFDIQPGGRVLIDGEWSTVVRVTKKAGAIVSVTTNARYVPVRGIEEVRDYEAPSAEAAQAVAQVTKKPPLCNYPGEGFEAITKAEWDATYKDYKGSRELGAGAVRPGGYRPDIKTEGAEQFGRHRVRTMVRRGRLVAVYLSDVKRTDPPAAAVTDDAQAPAVPKPEREFASRTVHTPAEPSEADAMRAALRAGVQVVSAPQLFPTPPGLAARMVELASIEQGHAVLEPSAGTGNILRAIREATGGSAVRTAVEISARLCDRLRIAEEGAEVINCDFMQFEAPASKYDRILMNPPFVNADDIKHIQRAFGMLKPGGRLVAICANGPRQQAALLPMVEQYGGSWEALPDDAFKESGTGVHAALLVLNAPH